MTRNIAETLLGAIVVIVAIVFFSWAYTRSNVSNTGGYSLVATFDQIGGLGVGSDVRISGIKVGSVTDESLDTQTYRAKITFSVENGVELPSDSSAAIKSTSLLGGNFLELEPGAEETMLKDGETVQFTQSAINLEDLLGRFIFGQAGGSGAGGTSGSGASGN